MTKRIFILNGHPAEGALNQALAESYAQAARRAGHDVRLTHIGAMDFDADYGFAGYKQSKPLEPDLEKMMTDLEWSNHFVLVAPMWWGGLPAKTKGAFDRAFLPGRAFDTRVPPGKMPIPMLAGRSGRLILTTDTPKWVLHLLYRGSTINQIRGQILHFVGIKPAKVSYFSGASHPKAGKPEKWLRKVAALGAQGI
jgi:putative NADPH-quinone reductase